MTIANQPAVAPPPPPVPLSSQSKSRAAWLAVAALLVLTVLILRFEGRIWWCACRTPTPFSTEVQSSHNSQHLFDPYSFSHLLHGIIFSWCLRLIVPRIAVGWRVFIAMFVEAAWEILENSPLIIERYRAATASLGYTGDSIVNSAGDVVSCAAGLVFARLVGWKWAAALFVAVELIMLWLIRDNLTLNVLMLLWPIDAIRQWQGGS
jgi:hypothetical protein